MKLLLASHPSKQPRYHHHHHDQQQQQQVKARSPAYFSSSGACG
jgi:hypothetical protein